MKVLIGGGSGFIGQHVARLLSDNGYQPIIVSRNPSLGHYTWDELSKNGIPENCEAIVNTAGSRFMTLGRWDDTLKKDLEDSRIGTTKTFVQIIRASQHKPRVLVSVTAIGCYKPSEDIVYTEESVCENCNYWMGMCDKWEDASSGLEELGVRRVIVRCGIVLGREGGYVAGLYWPFFFGLGGPISTGKQWFPWIHATDIAGIICHAILNPEVKGILNGVAPAVCTNGEFTKEFARSMFRFAILPVPAFVIRWLVGEERAMIMTEGQNIYPKRTLESGYKFEYPTIKEACIAL